MTEDGSLLALNEDVLLHILSYLSTREALRLSETARGVYSIAKGHALSYVTISGRGRVGEACDYFLADPVNRLALIRELIVPRVAWEKPHEQDSNYSSGDDYSVAPRLLAILNRAMNLQYLNLDVAERIIRQGPRTVRPLAASPKLAEVILDGAGTMSLEAVRKIKCPLRKLDLGSTGLRLRDSALFSNVPFIPSDHLEVLRFRNVRELRYPNAPVNYTLDIEHGLHFPSIRRVSMHRCNDRIVYYSAPYWPQLFPNVREIIIWNQDSASHPTSFVPCTEPTSHWSSLHRFRGAWTDMLNFRIDFPVHYLELVSVLSKSAGWEELPPTFPMCKGIVSPQDAMDLVIATSPVSLTLSTLVDIGPDIWRRLALLPRLRCLHIELSDLIPAQFVSRTHLAGMIPWVNKNIPCLGPIPLIQLEISIVVARSVYNSLSETVATIQSEWPIIVTQNISSLRYLSVGFTENTSTLSVQEEEDGVVPFFWYRCWSVSGSEDHRTVKAVSPEIGERLHRYLSSPEYDHDMSVDDVLTHLRLGSAV